MSTHEEEVVEEHWYPPSDDDNDEDNIDLQCDTTSTATTTIIANGNGNGNGNGKCPTCRKIAPPQASKCPRCDNSHPLSLKKRRSNMLIRFLKFLAPLVTVAIAVGATLHATATSWANISAWWHKVFIHSAPVTVTMTIASLSLALGALVVVSVILYTLVRSLPTQVSLVDFAIFRPPMKMRRTRKAFMQNNKDSGMFSEESCTFMDRLIDRSGIGDETALPPGPASLPPIASMKLAREECELVFTGCLDKLFKRTGLEPKDIDILIVTCSLFNPTPSIASMIINKYKMKNTIKSFNLSGMGCSAGVLAVDFAKDMLQVHKNANCLLFAHENMTMNFYFGNQKGMILPNVLFRMGGSCALLSNKPSLMKKSKFMLDTSVRVNTGASDVAYKTIFQEEDETNKIGVRLSRELVSEVGKAMSKNLTILGSRVLPWSEQIKFFISFMRRKLSKKYAANNPQYTPDFKKAFEHFCIHCGGRAVLDGIQKNLDLTDEDVEPSRATLYRFGNTSSSSVFYELNYIEKSGRIKAGDKVWQIAFGSGLKVCSAVWKAL